MDDRLRLNVEPGARSTVWGYLDGSKTVVLLFFSAMAVCGLVIAVLSLCGGEKE